MSARCRHMKKERKETFRAGSYIVLHGQIAGSNRYSQSGRKTGFVIRLIGVAFALLVVFGLCGAHVIAQGGKEITEPAGERKATIVVVRGETLWDIARLYKADSQDIRDYVLLLKKANQLKTPLLQEGQVLVLP